MAVKQSTAARFWSKVRVGDPEQCWEWQGALRKAEDGYGSFWLNGRSENAHRVAWVWHNGPILDGLLVLHHCDNPPCCNPAHLWLGTDLDNMRDRNRKGRANFSQGSCHGHAKLTEAQIHEIRGLTGLSQEAIARQYGVTQGSISEILARKRWRHVL